jgi:hypothetical protein
MNENPVVQAAVIGVMAIIVGFLLFTRVLNQGSAEEAATTPAGTATEAGAAPTTPAAGTATETGTAAPTPTEADAAAPAPPVSGTASPTEAVPGVPPPTASVEGAFTPGPGLPKPVVTAYDNGKVVVLLLDKRKGIDDRALLSSVNRVRGRGDIALFSVPAKDVSKYSRITEGVEINRVPALVVLRPKQLSKGTPEATVSYGFRGPESVNQAVEDALYTGKRISYDP